MSKKGLTHISDRANEWRYVDKDGLEQWLHPVSAYKASEDILYGQAVSVVTETDNASNEEDPDPYVRRTDTSRDVKTIGLALETVSKGETVHILPYGMFTYDIGYKGLDGIDEYNPFFNYSDVGKKVYVKNNEPGNLTTNEDEILQDYKHIICVGYLTDAPVEGSNQTLTKIEISISGDERGPVDHTQFEGILGEDVVINEDDPVRLFAIGEEKDEKFNFKLALTPQDHEYNNHDFIAIQRYDGKTVFLHPYSSLDLEGLEDNSDAAFVKMSKIYNDNFVFKKIDITDEYNVESVNTNIQVLSTALAEAFSEVSDGFEADIDSWYNTTNPFGRIDFTSKQPGGYFTIYISAGLYRSFEQTTIYNHGSYNNQGTVVLADARIGTRRNVIGAYIGSKFGKLEKGTKTLFLRLGEYTLDPSVLGDDTLYKSTDLNNKEGTVYYLGNNGKLTDKPYSQIDFVSKIATLKSHTKLLIDVGHSSKYYSGSFPIGYMKPCIYANGRYIPEYGFILMDGKTEYPCTAGSPYFQLYTRLQGQFDEGDLRGSDDEHFIIPLVTKQNQPMQIKYLSEGVYEDLTRTAFIRRMGRFEQEPENEEIQATLPKIDITSLVDFGITDTGYEKPDLDNLDIHLYIDPNKDYESGPHDWREIPVGFFNFNNYGTYGFSWSIEEDLTRVSNHTPYGVYYIKANVGDGRGIAYVDGNNQAPMKVDGCYYKVYVARKELYPRQFDLDGVVKPYISDTVYDINGEPDTTKAVSGKAVLDALAAKVDISELITVEGAIVKLGDKDKDIVSKVINLIADEDMPIFSKNGTITIGNDENKQCLVVRDGKVYKTGTTGVDKIFETEVTTVGDDNAPVTAYKINGEEIPTVTQVREHAELVIDDNDYMKSYANKDELHGKIHGMVFGYNGNVDASLLSGLRLKITNTNAYSPDKNKDAYIPIRYIGSNGSVETHLEGTSIYEEGDIEIERENITVDNRYSSVKDRTIKDIIKGVTVSESADRFVESLSANNNYSINFETVFDFEDGHIHFYTGNRNKENPSYATLHAGEFVTGSWSKTKKIFGERITDESLISTELADGSIQYQDENPYKDLKSKLGSALQAAYELPLAYWLGNNEKDWYNKSLGIVVERVRDVANNITTDVTRDIYSEKKTFKADEESEAVVDSNNKHLTYNYTEDEIESIKTYYNTLTDNYGQDITSTVGLLLAAAKETQERLLKAETSIFGADAESIPGDKKLDIDINIKGVSQEPTTFGLNRLVRAICAELYGTTNPESGNLELQLDSEGNKITSLSRIDDIERTIKGARNNDNDPDDFNVTSDNSLDSIDSTTYPYEPEVGKISEGVNVSTREKIEDTQLVDPSRTEKFNGTIDAIYRITKKLNALTKEINEEDNINIGAKRLNHAEDILAELLKEVYLDEDESTDDTTHSKVPNNGVSRIDKLTNALFGYELQSIGKSNVPFEHEFKNFIENGRFGRKTIAATQDVNDLKGTIPTTLDNYENYANSIDVIIDALGAEWYRKRYSDETDITSKRHTRDISTRLDNIENTLDTIVRFSVVKDQFEGVSDGTIVGVYNELTDKKPIDMLLSELANYLGNSKGVLDLGYNTETNPENPESIVNFDISVKDGHDIARGLKNLSTRLNNLEKYQAAIRGVIGNGLYGNLSADDSELSQIEGEFSNTTGVPEYEIPTDKINLLYKDLQAIKTSIWGTDIYYGSDTTESNWIRASKGEVNNENNIYAIIRELFSPVSPIGFDPDSLSFYMFNGAKNNKNLFDPSTYGNNPENYQIKDPGSLETLPSNIVTWRDKYGLDRFSVIENEIYHIRKFLGIEDGRENDSSIDLDLRYKYELKTETGDRDDIIAGENENSKVIFSGYNVETNLPNGDNAEGAFENDSILNELLFNINALKLLRANVGSNNDLVSESLEISDTDIPKYSKYEREHIEDIYALNGEDNKVTNIENEDTDFRNAFLRQVKIKKVNGETGVNAVKKSVTQRINDITDYLSNMGNYLTDRFEYLEGLDYIGKRAESVRDFTDIDVDINGTKTKLRFFINADSTDVMSFELLQNIDDTKSPIELENIMRVSENFIRYWTSQDNNKEFSIQITQNIGEEVSTTEYDGSAVIGITPYPINGNYYVYSFGARNIGVEEPVPLSYAIENGIVTEGNQELTKNISIPGVGNFIPLETVWKNTTQDSAIKFNGKQYNLNNADRYNDILNEVRMHNLLLQDIVRYIDETPEQGTSESPTTASLI